MKFPLTRSDFQFLNPLLRSDQIPLDSRQIAILGVERFLDKETGENALRKLTKEKFRRRT